jgi:hypothetical protein
MESSSESINSRQWPVKPRGWTRSVVSAKWAVGVFGLGFLAAITALIVSRQSHLLPLPMADAAITVPIVATQSTEQTARWNLACRSIGEAQQTLANVRDYTCTFIKRERIGDRLLPEETMILKVRQSPFSVHMHWTSPSSLRGQEVCYVAGRNHGCMRVHPAGILGILGFFSIDIHDPRAQRRSRHVISEAGMKHLIDSTARYWELERRLGNTEIQITHATLRGQPCLRIDTIHPDRSAGRFYACRCVLYLDQKTHLPMRMEAYDWPRRGRDTVGELIESCDFEDVRCNVGLTDGDFHD